MRSLFLLSILLTIPQTPAKLAQSPKTILDGAASDISKTTPALHLAHGGICNLPPLMDEQESLDCGSLTPDSVPTGPDPTFTNLGFVSVHQITNSEVVSRWMKNEAARPAPGWVSIPYDLGVPAYLYTHQSSPDAGITVGKGRFIVLVNGRSKDDVDRVARAVLRQISY